ncbi:MAG TPA: VanW family protein [Marmoricola sp.]|nr:VanW family protein [Marmoricola sp.]
MLDSTSPDPSADASQRKGRTRRRAVVLAVGAVLVLGALYGAAYAFTSDRIPRDVTVAGIDIGGLRPAAASQRLTAELGPRTGRTLVARVGGEAHRIAADETGLSLDVAATVAAAGGGRSLNPVRMLEVLTGGDEVEPVIAVDEEAHGRALGRLADRIDQDPVPGTVRFDGGTASAVAPRPGRQLDDAAASQALREALFEPTAEFELPVREVSAEVTAEEVRRALTEFGRPAMSGPVTIKVPGDEVQLSPAQLAPALGMVAEDGTLVPRLDMTQLRRSARAPLGRLVDEPRPATVVLRDGAPHVVPGEDGTEVDLDELADRLLEVLPRTGAAARTITMQARTTQPDFTTEDARGLGIREVVSEFTTYFPHSDYRNTNLGQAARNIDGTVLRPDDLFSFNDTVGERTAENGFIEGYIISDGVLEKDFGGGVSQVATTTYNAAFFAGLKDVEHHPHSLYFDRYPMGREATVAWGALDLRFQNDTPYGVLIESWIVPSTPSTSGEMHVRMWSTEYWDITAGLSDRYDFTSPEVRYDDSPACEGQSPAQGFSVDVFRYFARDGERVRTERDHVTYNAMDEIRCR